MIVRYRDRTLPCREPLVALQPHHPHVQGLCVEFSVLIIGARLPPRPSPTLIQILVAGQLLRIEAPVGPRHARSFPAHRAGAGAAGIAVVPIVVAAHVIVVAATAVHDFAFDCGKPPLPV